MISGRLAHRPDGARLGLVGLEGLGLRDFRLGVEERRGRDSRGDRPGGFAFFIRGVGLKRVIAGAAYQQRH